MYKTLNGLVVLILVSSLVGCDSTNNDNPDQSGPLPIPDGIQQIMEKPRYADATWSLLVTDLETGETFYQLNPDLLSFTGSTRKIFSVGLALNALGADARQVTRVHRQGEMDNAGNLNGNLVLVAAGDLAFGGRRIGQDSLAFTQLDHNEANGLGAAVLTPQDPLFALDALAADIKASGVNAITGDIAVDDRLFEFYRVPNGQLLITPMMLNENQIDVSITPTQSGQAGNLSYRPETSFFSVVNQTMTSVKETIKFSGDRHTYGVGDVGIVQGQIPIDYDAPIIGGNTYVGTYKAEDPNSFARSAFIDALVRNGVTVSANPVSPNPTGILPASFDYSASTLVASFESAPYSETAKLILKVSLNLGANTALSLFGLEQGVRTVDEALAAERRALIEFGLDPESFDFPTNGSGSPDSRATPVALTQWLTELTKTPVAAAFKDGLPILGVDGSLEGAGENLPGKGHVFAKTGTTVLPTADPKYLDLVAQNIAGYIETQSGRNVAFALILNDVGLIESVTEVVPVMQDQAAIASLIYESL